MIESATSHRTSAFNYCDWKPLINSLLQLGVQAQQLREPV